MGGEQESRARVYWDLMQKYKEQKTLTEDDAPGVAASVRGTMDRIRQERERQRESDGRPRLLVFDGLNTFIRNYAVVPEMDVNGEPVGGLVGTLRSVKAMAREVRPSRIVVVWDGPGGSRKRRGVLAEYKAGRKPKLNRQYDFESPEAGQRNFQEQYQRLRRLLDHLGVTQVEVDDVEADDVIAFLCLHTEPEAEKVVVTTDRDMLQLVDARTLVYSPTKKVYYSADRVRESFGVLPENFIHMKVLEGDGSDNVTIPELKGLGPKTIVKLFPFLDERPVQMSDVLAHCEANVACKNRSHAAWYARILAQRERLFTHLRVMQLAHPIISAQSVGKIRHAMSAPVPDFSPSEFRVALLREGIQLRDSDMESVFREYHVRAKGQEKKVDAG